MEEEINEFIIKNNEEMEKALQEVRDSYKDDIQSFEGKKFNLIRNGRRLHYCCRRNERGYGS